MSGEEALEIEVNHDLILMDLQLPDMDGYTISKKLRDRGITNSGIYGLGTLECAGKDFRVGYE